MTKTAIEQDFDDMGFTQDELVDVMGDLYSRARGWQSRLMNIRDRLEDGESVALSREEKSLVMELHRASLDILT